MDYCDIMQMKSAKKQLKKVTKLADQVKDPEERAIAKTSVKELKKWMGQLEYKDIPALLIGIYPRY